MCEIKLIKEDTDISSLEILKFDWDVVIKGRPYYVVQIKGYNHSIVGIYNGQNNLWMYPRDEEPSYENLVEYSSNNFGALWGYRYEPYNYIKNKWGESECFACHKYIITRNGEDFYDGCHGIEDVLQKIKRLKEHPIQFDLIHWKDEVIGTKVWYRSQPGIIESWIDKQACVIIEPDGIERFDVPAEFRDEDSIMFDDDFIKADVFDPNIYWFRD